jgi:hypothetical protein
MTRVIKQTSESTVDLYQIALQTPEYKLRDLYRGGVADQAKKSFDMDFDMRVKLEAILFDFMTGSLVNGGAFGTFANSAANKSNRVFNAHSRIQSSILPSTNDVTVGTPSSSTKFGEATLKAIVNYAFSFTGAFPDSDIIPTGEVIVRTDEIQGIADDLDIKTPAGEIGEKLLRLGYLGIGEYLGVNWKIIPDNTLAVGTCYPKFNKPLGILWLKPSEDDAGEVVDREHNRGYRWMKRTLGTAIPLPWRKNIARFTYKTA